MGTVFTAGDLQVIPAIVTAFESESEAGTIIHQIAGRENPDVTLRPAMLRSGTFEMLFPDPDGEADSAYAEAAFRQGVVWQVTASDRPTASMVMVVQGRVTRALDRTTGTAWTVTVHFQEVAP